MTIREALAEGNASLARVDIETSALDSSLLLAEVLNVSRSSLIAASLEPIPQEAVTAFRQLIKRRQDGECAAYILGKKEFYGLEFTVNPSVLVPRPDTETLVEAALRRVGSRESGVGKRESGSGSREWGVGNREAGVGKRESGSGSREAGSGKREAGSGKRESGGDKRTFRVLDLCTGSGAIAIALKYTMPELEVWAADISAEALETARANAARLLPSETIHFCRGDLFDALSDRESGVGSRESRIIDRKQSGLPVRNYHEQHSPLPIAHCSLLTAHCSAPTPHSRLPTPDSRFPIIVSNPPYIPAAEIPSLSPEVRMEPALALDGGGDGLNVIRKIVSRAPEFLCSGGTLLLEADPRQMATIARLYEEAGFFDIKTCTDLAGKERVICGISL